MIALFFQPLIQVDKAALDAMHDSAEVYLQSLAPWIQVVNKLFFKKLSLLVLSKHKDNQK